jgi:adenylylsulfate reductase subunit A
VGLFSRRKTVFVDSDILVIGGGMAGCGSTYESRYWGRDLKVVCVEKANIERSGAVAQGLYAINCYMGMQWGENQPEDHGKWQIMIHGESYKPIVAEAARKAATEVYNRIMVTHLLMDKTKPERVAGAVGFNVRNGNFYVFRSKAVIVCAGGASHIFKPRAVGEGMGRTWYAPWSSASAYALPILAGAKMTQMENRIVLTRFKDGYGPVGAYFLHLKTYTENAYGEEYESKWYDHTKELVGDYVDRHPVPTCLRNHALLEEVKAGRGPIRMVTKEAFQDPHKETVGWENFLGMTIGQAVVWASQNIDPKHTNPELTTSEPYVLGSHATCSGAWASGPEDYAPSEYQWGYNRMMTVDGLFGAGDTIGGTAHKFSSGSFTEGRIAGKAAVNYVNDLGSEQPQVSEAEVEDLKTVIFQPLENYQVGRNEIVAGTVSPSYLLPMHGLQRLEKIMDEYVGGPPPASAGLGAAPSGLGFGVCDASHDVPDGNAVAGLLLSGRSSEAGRYRLALLHPLPLRPALRGLGNGEGPRVSHRRLKGVRRRPL